MLLSGKQTDINIVSVIPNDLPISISDTHGDEVNNLNEEGFSTNVLNKDAIVQNVTEPDIDQADVLSVSLRNNSFWDEFSVIPFPGDGHCLITSIVNSMLMQKQIVITASDLLQSICSETVNNLDVYKSLLEESDALKIDLQLKNYVYHKVYNSGFGDLVPVIIARAKKLNIVIVSKEFEKGFYKLPFAIDSSDEKYIRKNGDNYDGIGINDSNNS